MLQDKHQGGDFNNNNGRQSRGHSTGSSSNPHFDFKSSTVALVQHREWTPDSRNAAGMTRATKNKDHNVSKDRINNVRREKSFSKIAHQEVEKSKVRNCKNSEQICYEFIKHHKYFSRCFKLVGPK